MDVTDLPKTGAKPSARGSKAVCTSGSPAVTDTMIQVMKDGGNAADAAIAAALLQSTIEPHFSSLAGSLTILYWDSRTKKSYQLDGIGSLVPHLPFFRPVSIPGDPFLGSVSPCGVIPGYMPALGAFYDKFATKSWAELCEPAIRAAEEGHVVTTFEYGVMQEEQFYHAFFPETRELFMPNGFMPEVGERFYNHKLGQTLRRLADEGPVHFTHGEWAKHFVQRANELGWAITMKDVAANQPRWLEPLQYRHRAYDVVQLAPPQRTGLFTAMVFGVLDCFDINSLGHYTESAETLYLLAHVLRRIDWELGLMGDPEVFSIPSDEWLSPEYLQKIARILEGSQPKVSLKDHFRVSASKATLAGANVSQTIQHGKSEETDTCELSIVDEQGNWLQMMHTIQAGGIPGATVDGVPMYGSWANTSLTSYYGGWLVGNGRIKNAVGSTIVFKDGAPYLSAGTPGYVNVTMPQVLSSVLDYGMDPSAAVELPRIHPLSDDYRLIVENRFSAEVVDDLAHMGILVKPDLPYNYHMGSFQMCWRDLESGELRSCTDPRRTGKAAGY